VKELHRTQNTGNGYDRGREGEIPGNRRWNNRAAAEFAEREGARRRSLRGDLFVKKRRKEGGGGKGLSSVRARGPTKESKHEAGPGFGKSICIHMDEIILRRKKSATVTIPHARKIAKGRQKRPLLLDDARLKKNFLAISGKDKREGLRGKKKTYTHNHDGGFAGKTLSQGRCKKLP